MERILGTTDVRSLRQARRLRARLADSKGQTIKSSAVCLCGGAGEQQGSFKVSRLERRAGLTESST